MVKKSSTNAADAASEPPSVSRERIIAPLNDDVAREYQALIA